ncbi:MAG: hypothetical protein ABS35_46500 [Kaistia sp. SCN 65-12]|nr:MAG: hypothetical protein ABS35_46500 [Kaistia sp. SCN 65-12]
MYQLFYSPGACSMAVHIILEEVGAEFELIAVSVANRDTQREPYLSINPKGRVPALRIPGETKVLTELPAILHYLASRYPDHGLAQTENPLLEARISAEAYADCRAVDTEPSLLCPVCVEPKPTRDGHPFAYLGLRELHVRSDLAGQSS